MLHAVVDWAAMEDYKLSPELCGSRSSTTWKYAT